MNYTEANERAKAILEKMTLVEKIAMTGGEDMFYIKGVERLGIPRVLMSDATQGVRIREGIHTLERSTAFPCPLLLASTWNPGLAYHYARCIGEECQDGGISILLGPGINLYRVSQCGRNFEYFGEDPHLASRMVTKYVEGVQRTGTIATLKHFVANNTDFRRMRSNSIVDERTLHEIYIPAFKAGIDAGAMAVMTSYNKVNGEYAGQSKELIDGLLRKQLGFKWLVMSDWWSLFDPVKAIKSGLNIDMPGHEEESVEFSKQYRESFIQDKAASLLEQGDISEDDINRMVKGILHTCIAMGIYDQDEESPKKLGTFDEHEQVALQTAREGIVLLRNKGPVLPIGPAQHVLVTGQFVHSMHKDFGSAAVEGYNNMTMWDALQETFGDRVTYKECPSDQEIREADVVIVSIGTKDKEGEDHDFNLTNEMNGKIIGYAGMNKNIVVVVNAGSGINMSAWNDHVAAIVYAWYPGQIGNVALAEMVAGKVNPSGKLPITIEKRIKDSPAYSYIPGNIPHGHFGKGDDFNIALPEYDVVYNEGVFAGYRWYDHNQIQPLYPFGFGLSYTTFQIDDLILSSDKIEENEQINVQCTVRNTGSREGAEVVQLYIHPLAPGVPRPPRELKGFTKVCLRPGEEKNVSIPLKHEDFAYYDSPKQEWIVEEGEYEIWIGNENGIRKLVEL